MDCELAVSDCTECKKLVSCRNQIVNGVGPIQADVVLVGEAPGETEDETGKPFTGRSGSVLNNVIDDCGLKRENIRITNCVRCRPPNNRDPYVDELGNCFKYLEMELGIIRPKVIVPLGRIPTKQIVDEKYDSVTSAVGNVMETILGGEKTIAVVSVHPAATLYNRDLRPEMDKAFEKISEIIDKSQK